MECLTQDEADKLAGADGDFHVRDLYTAISEGKNPSWTLYMQIMPFDEADNYRFNPFDLTKVWPHKDYPLIKVGKLTLNQNPTDNHAQIEQAAFEPNNLVPGIGLSPDKMLMGRIFAYADAHRARLGVNYKQIPVNSPRCPVNSYSKDGAMRMQPVSDPVYAPNSKGGSVADGERYPTDTTWESQGQLLRAPYTLHAEDDDYGQANALVNQVLDDAGRDRLVNNVAGHLLNGVKEPVLSRAFDYWRAIDQTIGDRIAEQVKRSQS